MPLFLRSKVALGVLGLLTLLLSACQDPPEPEDTICKIGVTLNDYSSLSRFERYSTIANIITVLEPTKHVGVDTRVYTIMSFDQIDRADIYVGSACGDLADDIASLDASLAAGQVRASETITVGRSSLTFTELKGAEIPQVTDAIYAAWRLDAEEECLLRAQVSFRSLSERSEDDNMILARDILSSIRYQDAQYGVPFADYIIYDNILIGALRTHCDRRQEAMDFLARHWIDIHTDELRDLSITDVEITTYTEGLTLDDLTIIRARPSLETTTD